MNFDTTLEEFIREANELPSSFMAVVDPQVWGTLIHDLSPEQHTALNMVLIAFFATELPSFDPSEIVGMTRWAFPDSFVTEAWLTKNWRALAPFFYFWPAGQGYVPNPLIFRFIADHAGHA